MRPWSRPDRAAPQFTLAPHFSFPRAHARAGAVRIRRVALHARQRRAGHFALQPAAEAGYRSGHDGHAHPLGFSHAHRLFLFGSSATRPAPARRPHIAGNRRRRIGTSHRYRHRYCASLDVAPPALSDAPYWRIQTRLFTTTHDELLPSSPESLNRWVPC